MAHPTPVFFFFLVSQRSLKASRPKANLSISPLEPSTFPSQRAASPPAWSEEGTKEGMEVQTRLKRERSQKFRKKSPVASVFLSEVRGKSLCWDWWVWLWIRQREAGKFWDRSCGEWPRGPMREKQKRCAEIWMLGWGDEPSPCRGGVGTGRSSAPTWVCAAQASRREEVRPVCNGEGLELLCWAESGRWGQGTGERGSLGGDGRQGPGPPLWKAHVCIDRAWPVFFPGLLSGRRELLLSLGCIENCFLEWPLARRHTEKQWCILVSFEHTCGGQKWVSVAMMQRKLLSEAQSRCFRYQSSLWSETGKFLWNSYGNIFWKDIKNTSNKKIVGRMANMQNYNLDDSQYGKLVPWYLKAF